MRLRRLFNLLILLVIISFHSLKADDFKWQIGEQLTYRVNWSFIRLGTVYVDVLGKEKIADIETMHVRFKLESSPLIFFVDMHNTYDCYIDDQMRPVKFLTDEFDGDTHLRVNYEFFYEDSIFTIEYFYDEDNLPDKKKTLQLKNTVYDGISLIFWVRKAISGTNSETVSAFFDDNVGEIFLDYHGPNKPVKIDAVDYEIPTYFIDGELLMKGIAGVTGPYKGWFAAGKQRPPIRALLKVFVGNVEVELESWKNWTPPKIPAK